jgi:hypothetical protein
MNKQENFNTEQEKSNIPQNQNFQGENFEQQNQNHRNLGDNLKLHTFNCNCFGCNKMRQNNFSTEKHEMANIPNSRNI